MTKKIEVADVRPADHAVGRRQMLLGIGVVGLGAMVPMRAYAVDPPVCTEGVDVVEPDDEISEAGKTVAAVVGGAAAVGAVVATGAAGGLMSAALVPEPGSPVEAFAAGVMAGIAVVLGGLAGGATHVANDPPRSNYMVHAIQYPLNPSDLDIYAYLGPVGQVYMAILVEDIARMDALYDLMELGWGAKLADDATWMAIHSARAYEIMNEVNASGEDVANAMRWAAAKIRNEVPQSQMQNLIATPSEVAASWWISEIEAKMNVFLAPLHVAGGLPLVVDLAQPVNPVIKTVGKALQEMGQQVAIAAAAREDSSQWVWICPA